MPEVTDTISGMNEQFAVAKAMVKWGGSFISGIGEALWSADRVNATKIKEAFSAEWQSYLELAIKDDALKADLDSLVDAIAERAHNTWLEVKIAAGWTLGMRDDSKKTHPHVMPYEDLTPGERYCDILAARAAILELKEQGYVLLKVSKEGKDGDN